jgi:hypothetical protein
LIRERFGQFMITSVNARSFLAQSLAEIGQFREAIAVATEGVEIAASPEHPASLVYAQWALGLAYVRRGDVLAPQR